MQVPQSLGVLAGIVLQSGTRVPLHTQIAAGLRELIRSGRLRPGDRLPGELDLVAYFKVSRQTVRYALQELEADNLVHRARGVGTTVTAPTIERSLRRFYTFAWEARARGSAPKSDIIERRTERAQRRVLEQLDLPRGGTVERIKLLRTADGEPLLLDIVTLPAEIASVLDRAGLERESIYDTLEQRLGVRATHARETIRPIVLTGEDARLLHVRAGSPAFLVERLTWSDTRPIELRQSMVRGDRYLYSVELVREAEDLNN